MSTPRVFNFSAGPATLPLPVLEEAREHLLSLPGVGASVLEISHRSPTFKEILAGAESNIRTLLALPDSHRVLFLPGGATLQFSMVPLSLLRGRKGADYVLTGSWGKKAIKEAAKEGTTHVAWDGAEDGFVRVPTQDELDLDPDAAYVHLTSNETIQGVQFRSLPETGSSPLVVDASSDFLSEPIAADRIGLLYAGAQKNVGPAGVTVVVVDDALLDRIPDGLPSMLDYRVHAAKQSAFNTPPVFPIYLVGLVTRWILDEVGGLAAMADRNQAKASKLYGAIDGSGGFYRGHAEEESRSRMNVAWRLPSEELETRFLEDATEAGLSGLKGHRSVGGLRASIYNAMPDDGIDALVSFMEQFQAKAG